MRAALAILLVTASAFAADDYPGAPASVTAAYIEGDGAGLALDGATVPKLLSFTTWEDAPGWDSFVVIKSYDIGAVGWPQEKSKDGDKADVQIIYHVLGSLDGLKFTSKPAEVEVNFSLERIKGRWKIEVPQLPPHLFVAGAISALTAAGAKDDAVGKASLEQLHALEK